MGRLEGRTALITGGSSGMALATAKLFATEGATVVITGRDQDQLDAAVAEIGPAAEGMVCDSGDLSAIDALAAALRAKYRHIDVLFASVGGWSQATLQTVTPDDFDTTFNTTVRGTLFTVQRLLPLLPNDASIILNGSTATVKGDGGGTVYAASKAAVRSFARTWAYELRDRRIRVNVVSPGPIDTPAYQQASPEQRERRRALIPRGEFGRPEEVAAVVLFLASDESSFVNGSELFVDGGLTQV